MLQHACRKQTLSVYSGIEWFKSEVIIWVWLPTPYCVLWLSRLTTLSTPLIFVVCAKEVRGGRDAFKGNIFNKNIKYIYIYNLLHLCCSWAWPQSVVMGTWCFAKLEQLLPKQFITRHQTEKLHLSQLLPLLISCFFCWFQQLLARCDATHCRNVH